MTVAIQPSVKQTSAHHALDLLWVLVARNVKLRYRGSFLGVVWSQLGPLSVIAVMAFVFRRVVRLNIPHYPVFVFIGMLAWVCFQGSLVASTDSVLSARDLVRRPGFPVQVLPVAEIATQFVYFFLSVPVLILAMLATGVRLHATMVALPLIMAVQFLLLLGPGYLLAAMQVRFRDIGHLVSAALLPLFYATPVFYALQSVPAHYHTVYLLNPMASVIDSYRAVIIDGRWGDLWNLAVISAVSAVVAMLGAVVYARAVPRFAEEV
jgi:lipopolysaccharide transport system permease protein